LLALWLVISLFNITKQPNSKSRVDGTRTRKIIMDSNKLAPHHSPLPPFYVLHNKTIDKFIIKQFVCANSEVSSTDCNKYESIYLVCPPNGKHCHLFSKRQYRLWMAE
jgi:hypothetical protein